MATGNEDGYEEHQPWYADGDKMSSIGATVTMIAFFVIGIYLSILICVKITQWVF